MQQTTVFFSIQRKQNHETVNSNCRFGIMLILCVFSLTLPVNNRDYSVGQIRLNNQCRPNQMYSVKSGSTLFVTPSHQ